MSTPEQSINDAVDATCTRKTAHVTRLDGPEETSVSTCGVIDFQGGRSLVSGRLPGTTDEEETETLFEGSLVLSKVGGQWYAFGRGCADGAHHPDDPWWSIDALRGLTHAVDASTGRSADQPALFRGTVDLIKADRLLERGLRVPVALMGISDLSHIGARIALKDGLLNSIHLALPEHGRLTPSPTKYQGWGFSRFDEPAAVLEPPNYELPFAE